jgi:hypothetical protein
MTTEKVLWYVTRYSSKESNEGSVMWETETEDNAACTAKAEKLQQEFPLEDFEVSDLSEAAEVWDRDVLPVLESLEATKH